MLLFCSEDSPDPVRAKKATITIRLVCWPVYGQPVLKGKRPAKDTHKSIVSSAQTVNHHSAGAIVSLDALFVYVLSSEEEAAVLFLAWPNDLALNGRRLRVYERVGASLMQRTISRSRFHGQIVTHSIDVKDLFASAVRLVNLNFECRTTVTVLPPRIRLLD